MLPKISKMNESTYHIGKNNLSVSFRNLKTCLVKRVKMQNWTKHRQIPISWLGDQVVHQPLQVQKPCQKYHLQSKKLWNAILTWFASKILWRLQQSFLSKNINKRYLGWFDLWIDAKYLFSPQDWIISEKSLATAGVILKAKVITGKATAPPPSDVMPINIDIFFNNVRWTFKHIYQGPC